MDMFSDCGCFDGTDEFYEDVPKKRGRKKKDSSKKRTGKDHSDENDKLIESIINGEDVDAEQMEKAFEKYSSKIDLSCDTTGVLPKLRTAEQPLTDDDNITGSVIKWCNQMMSKGTYTEGETAAFSVIMELVSHLDSIDVISETIPQ